jgi:chemotaxis protein MotA
LDPSPLLAIIFGFSTILLGNYMEGGEIEKILQLTAFLIVVGGSVGAVWLSATNEELKNLVKFFPRTVKPHLLDRNKLADDMVKASNIARREGMLAVEGILPQIEDPFLRRGLQMLVDGHSAEDMRKVLELEADMEEHHNTAASKLVSGVGGYSPTIGIVGAVLGLVHVMSNLSDPSAVGPGIAAAFVATIYGVGFANLIFLPLGDRLKKIAQGDAEVRAMVLTGLDAIAAGSNARQLEEMLSVYRHGHKKKEAA